MDDPEATPEPNDATAEPNDATAEPNDATAEPNDATAEPNDATPEPNDATPEPNDATPEPNDATPEPNDATPEPNDATPATGMVQRVIRIIGWTSIVAGLLILGFVAQQLFVTTWFAEQHQETLAEEAEEHFASTEVFEVEYSPSATVTTTEDGSVVTPPGNDGSQSGSSDAGEPRTLLVEATPSEGDAFAVVRVPSIERLQEGWTVVEGVRLSDLKNGAGHMPKTPLPGLPGNAVISGHRTTYGAPFHEFDTLEAGDIIEVDTATGTHVYAVREVQIVRPTDVWVTDPREGSWLTLTTCHPKFSSRQRLIVFAELIDGPNYEAIYA